ncbi:acyl-CoA thioesterase [Zavarzinia sp. CC-PAN008]|uniref:acyl-CoA thioesterase n=1 Tax=Zavarzinia sp. CC-PAN008 TaxID=3243332 RepID=UPI003F74A9AC
MPKLFFDLKATHNPHRWFMPVEPHICVGHPDSRFMFGGVGLGSSIAALERTTGRPLVWATAQYMGYARPPSIVDIDVWTPVQGKFNTQANAKIHIDDREIITVMAALGSRPGPTARQGRQMPEVPPPDDCDPDWFRSDDDLNSRLDVRIARGFKGPKRTQQLEPDGRTLIWARPRGDVVVDATVLAILADFVPRGISSMLGAFAGGNSLDNTLRIHRLVPTEWVLCDIWLSGMADGFAHGDANLFSQDGVLMATASQSMIVRAPRAAADG